MNDLTLAASPWKFGINDPSFIAWLIFFVYFLTAILCWRAPASAHTDKEQRSPFLWKVLSFYLILLGLNKQLDLHQLLLEFGRDLIAEEGQQNYSTMLLGGIIALVGVFGIGVFLLGFKFLSGASRNLCWAYAVFVGLLGFQVLRFLPGPISGVLLAHVFTEEDGLLHIHIIELLELASLLGIGWLARIHRRIGFQPVWHNYLTGRKPILRLLTFKKIAIQLDQFDRLPVPFQTMLDSLPGNVSHPCP